MGNRVQVKVVKNKMAPPFKQAEFDILFAKGISKAGELVDLGVDRKVLEKSGAWYSYKGERIGQGRDAVRDLFETNQAMAKEVEARLRELAGVPVQAAARRAEEKAPEPRESKKSHAGRGS
jgi:recombination protein RecA